MAKDNLIVWFLEQKAKEKILVLFECSNNQSCKSIGLTLRFNICLQSIMEVFPGNLLEIYVHIGSWLVLFTLSGSS